MRKPVLFRVTNNLNIGGVQRRLRSVLPRLTDEFEVHIVTYKKKGPFFDELIDLDVKTHFIKLNGKWDIFGIYRMAKLFRQYDTDIVHTHSLGGNISGIIAAAWAGVPVRIGQVHNCYLHWYAPGPIHRQKQIFQEKWVHRFFSDKILFVSRESLDYFQSKTHLPKDRLALLHNGFDFSAMDPGCDPVELKQRLGIDPGKKIVGLVGRIVPEKNIEFYLNFAHEVLQKSNDYRFLVIGGGNEQLIDSLKAKVNAWKAEKSIIFTGEQNRVYDFYNLLDCFFFSSDPRKEGMPGVVLEACFFGLPIISRRSKPVEEIAEYYPGIHFIEKGVPAVNGLEVAISQPLCVVEPVRREFGIESMVVRTKSLYHKLYNEKLNFARQSLSSR